MSTFVQTIKQIVKKFDNFSARAGGINLYFYQLEPAKAIINSIRKKLGHTIVVILSRQAGKDEMLVNLFAYLLLLFAHRELEIVVTNPTYKPQTEKMMLRFESRLDTNLLTKTLWKKRHDFIRMIGKALINFLSADGKASVVGATASLGLFINEAQDVEPGTIDKKFEPMRASTFATKVVVGTVWTSTTYLARETKAALEEQKKDGIKRVFIYTVNDVRKVNPAYGRFVDEQVRKLGRQHPLVKTQYFCEEIDAIAGMFNARRLALMQGDITPPETPMPGHIYALTLDIAGVDEAVLELAGMSNPGRDQTTLDIIDIDLSQLDTLQKPTYRVIKRMEWTGENHVIIFGAVTALVDIWHPQYIIIDATGVGEGLYSMMQKKYPSRAMPVKFTQQSKSEIGYSFLGIIEAGRFRDCCQTEIVREQYQRCTSEILIGPAKTMRWGVKDGTRGTDGQLTHDDHVLADALITELDKMDWYVPSETTIIEPAKDILQEMDKAY